MDRVWLKLIGVMIGASIIKYVWMQPLFWVTVDLAALAVCYFLLRSAPYINLRASMWYLGGITAISVLVDLGIINGFIGNILSLAVVCWLLWRNSLPRVKRQPLRHKWHK